MYTILRWRVWEWASIASVRAAETKKAAVLANGGPNPRNPED